MADNDDTPEATPDEFSELSLDDLGAAYARVAAEHDPEAFATPGSDHAEDGEEEASPSPSLTPAESSQDDDHVVTPETIIEGAPVRGAPREQVTERTTTCFADAGHDARRGGRDRRTAEPVVSRRRSSAANRSGRARLPHDDLARN